VICTLQAGNRLKPDGVSSEASYDKVFECLSRQDRVLALWFACRAHPLP
jgi:hypothetical protein